MGRKGGEKKKQYGVGRVVEEEAGGEGEKEGLDFSRSRMERREEGESQGGGRMLARRWRLRRRASQRGMGVRWGGRRGGRGPCGFVVVSWVLYRTIRSGAGALTVFEWTLGVVCRLNWCGRNSPRVVGALRAAGGGSR